MNIKKTSNTYFSIEEKLLINDIKSTEGEEQDDFEDCTAAGYQSPSSIKSVDMLDLESNSVFKN